MSNWVFVWTLGDVVGVVLLGLIVLFFVCMFILLIIDNLWLKLTGKHLPYNRQKKS